MRNKHIYSMTIIAAQLLLFCSESFAAIKICSSPIKILSASQTNLSSTAHVVELDPSTCSNACPILAYRRAYIDFGDKQLFAFALNASMSSTSYAIAFDDASPPKGDPIHSNYTCKILSIWK